MSLNKLKNGDFLKIDGTIVKSKLIDGYVQYLKSCV
jgi:hypothetical protein